MYVSDVTKKDVDIHISHLFAKAENENNSILQKWYSLLVLYLNKRQLIVIDNHFWNTSLSFNSLFAGSKHMYNLEYGGEETKDIINSIGNDDLVFIKGDANYRRVILCRKWDATANLSEITHYFPSNFVLLRTMKSVLSSLPLLCAMLTNVQIYRTQWRVFQKK